MKLKTRLAVILLVGGAAAVVALALVASSEQEPEATTLPKAEQKGKVSLEEALAGRRSVRDFRADKLTEQQIAQLCWAAQGITEKRRGFRTAPSAGALYPLELYVVTADGARHYVPGEHAFREQVSGDAREKLQAAALGQPWVGKAPATFVITAVFARTARKYGQRARRYVFMEAGHAGQNLLLQATALGLGAVPVGAFHEKQVSKILSLPEDHVPVYLIPVGVPAK